jgi:hypothetical protein
MEKNRHNLFVIFVQGEAEPPFLKKEFLMKVRNVVIEADLKGVETKYLDLFRAVIKDMQVVLENDAWDHALRDVIAGSNGLEGELSQWKNKTWQQIRDRFFVRYDKEANTYHVRLIIKTYYTIKRVVGYGVASDDIIRVNTKYLSSYSAKDSEDRKKVGSNLIHEEYHNRGMDHDSSATARRKHSIAYLSNDAFEIAYDAIFIKKTASTTVDVPPVTLPSAPVEETPDNPEVPVILTPPTPGRIVTVCGWSKKWGFIPWYSCWEEIRY